MGGLAVLPGLGMKWWETTLPWVVLLAVGLYGYVWRR